MKESQIAAMEEFIDNVKILINALGYKVLEPLLHSDSTASSSGDDVLLYINKGNAVATGKVTSEGFVVLKGATINEKMSAKSLGASVVKLREKYLSDGKVENLTTTEDILFSSSSAAADFILGYSVSGPKTWTDKAGRSLKEIENTLDVYKRQLHGRTLIDILPTGTATDKESVCTTGCCILCLIS